MAGLWSHDALLGPLHCLSQIWHSCLLHLNSPKHPKTPQNPTKSITSHQVCPHPSPQARLRSPARKRHRHDRHPSRRMDDLKRACDLLQQPIKHFIAEKSPSHIMVDFLHDWAVNIGQELNTPVICYLTLAACSAVFFWTPEFLPGEGRREARPSPRDMTVPPDWVDFPSQVACRDHEAVAMHNLLYGGANSSGGGARFVKIAQGCRAFAIRTCPELEADYLKLYSKITGKPVIPVGILPPPEKAEETGVAKEEPWGSVFAWLDKQQPKTVVFVGFGSECKLKKEEVHEIAYGLELSGLPFLFSLQKPDWGSDDEILPPGFESRAAGKGVVRIGWAPQREILSHPSIGGSLFQAGWGSVMENLANGNCLVLLPFIINQPLETRLLVEKALAVEVERAQDGSFTRNGIASALRKAMVDEEGEALRANTKEAAHGIFANRQLHHAYINKFVDFLKE